MREIKFRAWDKKDKKFYRASVGDTPNIMLHDKKGECTEWSIEPRENLELMQFTGLHDKNGKEIYEGDIVRGKNLINNFDDETPDMKIISWNDEEAEFEFRNMKNEGHQSGYTFCKNNLGKFYEVIGNIYENPELLNKK